MNDEYCVRSLMAPQRASKSEKLNKSHPCVLEKEAAGSIEVVSRHSTSDICLPVGKRHNDVEHYFDHAQGTERTNRQYTQISRDLLPLLLQTNRQHFQLSISSFLQMHATKHSTMTAATSHRQLGA